LRFLAPGINIIRRPNQLWQDQGGSVDVIGLDVGQISDMNFPLDNPQLRPSKSCPSARRSTEAMRYSLCFANASSN
jgi:hypothetical protein